MKKIPFIILFPLLVSLMPVYPYAADAAGGPGIVLEERFFAAGKVQEGAVIEHIFTFSNKGDKVLNIDVKSD